MRHLITTVGRKNLNFERKILTPNVSSADLPQEARTFLASSFSSPVMDFTIATQGSQGKAAAGPNDHT